MNRPKLSIIIPTYNRAELLQECLQSMQPVTVDCEILVLDNASEDETPERMQTFIAQDPRIRYIRHERNLGALANYNYGMKEARGEYMCLLGDDDLVLPTNFEKKVAILDAHPEIGLIHSLWYRIDECEQQQGVIWWPGLLNYSYIGGRNEFLDMLAACYMALQAVVFRRELWERFGGLDERPEITTPSDWDLLLRYCYHTQTAFISEPLVCVRVHSSSHTESIGRKQGLFAKGRIAVWRKWLVEHENPPVLDEYIWHRMVEAFLPDLRWEFGNDLDTIEHYLKELEHIKHENHQKVAARFHSLTQAFIPSLSPPHPLTPSPPYPLVPSWWLKLWQRVQRESGGCVLCIGPQNERFWGVLTKEGWRVYCDSGNTGSVGSAELSKCRSADCRLLTADSLIVFSEDWRRAAQALKPGGTFLIGVPEFPEDVQAWREALEATFEASAHLVDPEADCPWLFAFGWKGDRIQEVRRSVLIVANQQAFKVFGGAETQMLETLFCLRDQGVRADVSLSVRLPERNYDLMHVFNFLWQDEKRDYFRTVQIPQVVSTIFWDYSESWHDVEVARTILRLEDEGAVLQALQGWSEGTLRVQGLSKEDFQVPPAVRESQRSTLECAYLLLPNGEREAEQLQRTYGQLPPIRVVPNAVRPKRFLNATPERFIKQFGLRDFVLCAARIEPWKNQAMLVWALRQTGLPLVLAGRESDPDYANTCRKWAKEKVHFVGELSADMLASACAAARVHALPSWAETPGLVNLEAGLAGCALVIGNRGTEQEYFGEYAFPCDPADWQSIRDAVLRAWEETDPARKEARRAHILSNYTWQRTAQVTAEAYEEAIRASRCWFTAPCWEDARTWQPVVAQYVRAYKPADGALLQLYAGDLTGSELQTAYELVAHFLLESGEDPEGCPDIEIVDTLPLLPKTRIILTGSPLDAHLQQKFASTCVPLEGWRVAA